MNKTIATLAYLDIIKCLEQNNQDVLKHIEAFNNAEKDHIIENQMIDDLGRISLSITKDNYELYCAIIDNLHLITEKDSYKMSAEIHSADQSNIDNLKLVIRKGLAHTFSFQLTDFSLDVANTLVIYAIAIRDNVLLQEAINQLNVARLSQEEL